MCLYTVADPYDTEIALYKKWGSFERKLLALANVILTKLWGKCRESKRSFLH